MSGDGAIVCTVPGTLTEPVLVQLCILSPEPCRPAGRGLGNFGGGRGWLFRCELAHVAAMAKVRAAPLFVMVHSIKLKIAKLLGAWITSNDNPFSHPVVKNDLAVRVEHRLGFRSSHNFLSIGA